MIVYIYIYLKHSTFKITYSQTQEKENVSLCLSEQKVAELRRYNKNL